MPNTISYENASKLIEQWWHNCSYTACSLPQEHMHAWLKLISEVVRRFRLMQNCRKVSEKKTYLSLCREALNKSRWELMLLGIYGHIPTQHMQELETLQHSLELALRH